MKFVPWFAVRVKHDYYPDAVCSDVVVEPAARTRRLLDGYRMRLRELPDGVAVLAPLDADGENPLIAVQRGEVFAFELRARNPDFALFTDLRELPKTDKALKLVEQAPPLLARLELRADKAAAEPYEIRFKARAARWAYYLLTDRSGEFSIVDSGKPAIAFSASNRTLLNKNSEENDAVAAALARQYPDLQRLRFLSDQPVPCSSTARKIELRLGSRRALETLPNPSIQRPSRVRQKAGVEDAFHQVVKYLKAS
jgi:hypothetical protein